MTALLATLAIFLLTGAAAAVLLRLPLPGSRAAMAAMLFLIGVGATGALLYILGAIGVPLRTSTFAAVPLLAAIVSALRWKTLSALAAERHGRQLVAGIVTALPLAVLLLSASVLPTRDYDGRVTWLPKARAIALEGSLSGPFFQGDRGLNLHNRYPLLMPLDAAAVMKLTGRVENETTRWLYVLIAVAAITVLRATLTARFGAAGAWTAAATAWLPLLTSIEGGALAAYNDLTLAAFFGIAVLTLIASEKSPNAWRVIGLFAAFAVLTKNEGIALALAIVAAAVLARRPTSRAAWAWLLLPIAAAEALVSYWRTTVPAAYDERYGALVTTLPSVLQRAPTAIRALLVHAIDFSEWGVFWIAFIVAVVVGLSTENRRQFAVPLIAILAALGAYTLALTVTSWNINELAAVAANRLLSHLLLPAAYVIAMAFEQK